MTSDFLVRWRYRWVPNHIIGEILSKSWIDSAIPFLMLLISVTIFQALTPGLLSFANLSDLSHTAGEYLLMALGLTIVVMAGGIDLSVGSVFALAISSYKAWPAISVGRSDWRSRRRSRWADWWASSTGSSLVTSGCGHF